MDGVRVLEIGQFALVPSAAAILADWGAEVVKIEHPVQGDPIRGLNAWGVKPGTGGFTYLWELFNRNKRSVGIDVGTAAGREVVLRLAEASDVLVTSFLPSARQRLGIDVDDVMARNPRLIYARASGQGPQGPEADAPGFDGSSFWFRTGLAASATPADASEPNALPGPAFGDVQLGAYLAGGIAAALFARERTGRGTVVDVSLLAGGMWSAQASIVGADLLGTGDLPKFGRREHARNPLTNTYRTADGRFLALMVLQSDRYWTSVCAGLGAPELAEDQRFCSAEERRKHAPECIAALDQIFGRHPLSHWRAVLAEVEWPWSVVQQPAELVHDAQARANGYVQDVDYGDGRRLPMISAPIQFGEQSPALQPAPELGADTELVLLESGYDWDEIAVLKAEQAII
ncbi:MAG TPA: CoA transferase [Acidimicrobiia bacterium]|nr:CoA transferase [Acidimicrobiia bacterium]